MNKIKKILLFLFLILPVTLFAKEYDLKDTNLKIALDSNWTVFTRDNIKDNSLLSKYDMTEEYLTNYMNKRDCFLYDTAPLKQNKAVSRQPYFQS